MTGTKETIRINVYKIVADAVHSGAAYGWQRAHKHTDNPSQDVILDEIENAILNDLCEVIDFGTDE